MTRVSNHNYNSDCQRIRMILVTNLYSSSMPSQKRKGRLCSKTPRIKTQLGAYLGLNYGYKAPLYHIIGLKLRLD
ncbi:hypothetical protein GIB67_012424 [Kingdonia uniflora]|uniref:Uncharacterized protein n=1 Tax=Kingdonia uniflora TaxID=39325 RepID=A0A7J7LLT1_9MAGN|nr:hypothetical protein GIB67_012424 [Kingdonia uniflora]